MTNSRGCEHVDTNVETASNRLNGVADPEGATSNRNQQLVAAEIILKDCLMTLLQHDSRMPDLL